MKTSLFKRAVAACSTLIPFQAFIFRRFCSVSFIHKTRPSIPKKRERLQRASKRREIQEEEMENGIEKKKWNFRARPEMASPSHITIRGILETIINNIDGGDERPRIPLGHGDPSSFPCFRTCPIVEDAVVSTVRSAKYNCYPPSVGILPARRAIAEYLSHDLPYKVSPDDVFITPGCTQSIEVAMAILAHPGANILLPRPGFPLYEARATFSSLEFRHFDLLPDHNWEIDLNAVEALADENTVAMVIINPGNPCGNVFSRKHMVEIAMTAKKLGILIIADEVYGHLTFGSKPFIPMGTFSSVAPVLTLGSISKRWAVPGWRLGWLVPNDPHGILKEAKIIDSIKNYFNVTPDAATFVQTNVACKKEDIQNLTRKIKQYRQDQPGRFTLFARTDEILLGAIPEILGKTGRDFFDKAINILRQSVDICYNQLKEIGCITCPYKAEGSMFMMVKLNLSQLEDIYDDLDFCCKLAKEESVIILPGCAVGLKNWLRVTFAIDPASLEDALGRLKSFCLRHTKKH